ncbi:helix-turn-helix transcriptional regulator [Ruminococcus sp.]|mgnify:CR=1 FL=1|uniref:helix-turn-helix domain-containing protein n=1 Tax=Ruminococcus sp. TaxID=41978 RepID=UPI0025F1A5F4|nr:helix-turn-helix transcriptional regulator [Ruminococcus sp.]
MLIIIIGGFITILDPKIVGNVIRHFRESKGLSQEVVSGFADIGRTYLSAIERGERKPTLETFYRIAEAMRIRPSVILAEIEKRSKLDL